MADLKSLESLLQQVADQARAEVAGQLRPHIKAIAEAAAALEAALGGPRRRGRRSNAEIAAAGASAAKPAAKGKAKGRPAGGKKVKRGALLDLLRSIISGASGPMKAADIRNAVLKNPAYKGRDPKILYSQVMQTVGRMPDVVKVGDGLYGIKGAKK